MNNFGYFFLFFLLFVLIYVWNSLFIGSLKGFNKLTKSITETVLFCAFSIAFEVILYIYIPSQNFFVFLSSILVLLFFNSYYSVLIAYIIAIVFYYGFYGFTSDVIFEIVLMGISMAICWSMKYFKIQRIYIFMTLWVLLFFIKFGYTLYLGIISSYDFWAWVRQLFYWLILPSICIVVKQGIVNLMDSANTLYQSSLFSIKGYYRSAKLNERTFDFVKRNNVSTAVVGLVDFNIKSKGKKEISIKAQEELRLTILDKLRVSLTEKPSLLFKANERHYGFLSPINLSSESHTNYQMHKWFSDLSHKLNFIKSAIAQNGEFSITPFYGFSVYGVDSGDINRIISNCEFALQSRMDSEDKTYIFYNPTNYEEYIEDGTQLSKLNQIIHISNIYPAFFNIFDFRDFNTLFYFASPTLQILISEEKQVLKLLKQTDLWSTYLRYVASTALKVFLNQEQSAKLAIRYDAEYINSPWFQANKFINKLAYNGLKLDKLVIFLDCDQHKKLSQKFWNDVEFLRSKGVEFGVNGLGSGEMNTNFILSLQPKYLNLVDDVYNIALNELEKDIFLETYNQFANKIGAILMYMNIENVTELKRTMKYGINFVGGPLFENYEFTPQKLSKQSKIYIEEILSGV